MARAKLPPRWVIHAAWRIHRGIYRVSGGRMGLSRPKPGGWGTLRLTTTGRRSGRERSVLVGYYEDGPNLVTMAMNGWGAAEPAWWLNLLARPEATAELNGEFRHVTARAAVGDERRRLWDRWRTIDANLDEYAARRPRETTVVVLETRSLPEIGGSAG
ncbi:nitroreductase/quinone reductase family protein [Catellatospora vulcania]|uniref:nitroreductase/quinone reductase family protein n=1 Tax=Catellatospora vulcania TaxID=1460450 RepID=UPI0012D46AEB|nr:nitroreductase/quinone reductase family protein [Catellatospora vulcania]